MSPATIPDLSVPKHRHFLRACSRRGGQPRGPASPCRAHPAGPNGAHDHAALHLLQRGAVVAPADTTTPSWAKELASNSFAAFLTDLGAASAAAKVDRARHQCRPSPILHRHASRSSALPVAAPWVGEGSAFRFPGARLAVSSLARHGSSARSLSGRQNSIGSPAPPNCSIKSFAKISPPVSTGPISEHCRQLRRPCRVSCGRHAARRFYRRWHCRCPSDLAALASAVSGPGFAARSRSSCRGQTLRRCLWPCRRRRSPSWARTHWPPARSWRSTLGRSCMPPIARRRFPLRRTVTLHMSDLPMAISTPPGAAARGTTESMCQQGKVALRVLARRRVFQAAAGAVAWISATRIGGAATSAKGVKNDRRPGLGRLPFSKRR